MIASDDLPDMMSITDSDIYTQLVEADKVWDLQEFLETYMPDSSLLTDFPEDIRETLINTYGGWYSFPSHMNSADCYEIFPPNDEVWITVKQYGSNMCIMFNKDIMDALGITQEDVSTESGFLAACEVVKNSGYEVDGQSVLPVVLQHDSWIDSSLDAILVGNQAQQDKEGMPWVSYGPILADNGAQPVIGIDRSSGKGWIHWKAIALRKLMRHTTCTIRRHVSRTEAALRM